MTVRKTTVQIRDAAIHVRRAGPETGQAPPILFLHGVTGAPTWLPFFDALSADREIIVPDHPGYGASDNPPWVRNLSDLAMFYLDFMEELGLTEVHVVGHSLGGWVGAEIAVRDRSRLKSLTLISPAGLRVPGNPPGDIFIWNAEEGVRNAYHDQSMASAVLDVLLSDEEREIALKNRFAAAKYCWQPRLFNPDLEKWLHRIKLKTLVVWGRDDKIFAPAYADLWVQRLPQAELLMLEECGHLPQIEKSDVVGARVRQFMQGAGQ
jgi:pimeloyl-ACP methyl ester carboxylesterase